MLSQPFSCEPKCGCRSCFQGSALLGAATSADLFCPFEHGGVSLLQNNRRALLGELRFGVSVEAHTGIKSVLLLADLGRG